MAEKGLDIRRAAELLSSGELVAVPTETVYGLAANALNENAVLKIFQAKQRPFFDPLIVHISDIGQVSKYADWEDGRLQKLAEVFWPGPLTILVPKKNIIPDLVSSGLPRVGLRVPKHPLTLELLRQLPFPLAAPSANPFGYISPTQSSHVQKQLDKQVSYILEGGPSDIGLESTIVGVEQGELLVYRVGGLATEKIEEVAGKCRLQLNASSDPKSPGQLRSHYAPRKPLSLITAAQLQASKFERPVAIIGMKLPTLPNPNCLAFELSKTGDLNEAAVNLFHSLRLADDSEAVEVFALPVPEEGLGRAINDRLRRAAVQ